MSCKNTGRASLLFKDCGCGCKGKKQEQKFVISLMSAIVFFTVANPEIFRLTRKMFGSWVASPTGCSSTRGLVLHAFVFFLITWGLMNLKKERADGDTAIDPALKEGAEGEAPPAEGAEGEAPPAEGAEGEAPPAEEEPPAEEDDGEFASFTPGPGALDAMAGGPESAKLANVAMNGGQMNQMLGAPSDAESYPSPLKKGEYQQCRCSDGSSVTLMR